MAPLGLTTASSLPGVEPALARVLNKRCHRSTAPWGRECATEQPGAEWKELHEKERRLEEGHRGGLAAFSGRGGRVAHGSVCTGLSTAKGAAGVNKGGTGTS